MKRCGSFNYSSPPLIQGTSNLKKARSSQQVDKVENFSRPLESHGDQDNARPNEAAYHPHPSVFVTKKDKASANFLLELHYAKDIEISAVENLGLALEAKKFIRDSLYNKNKGSFKSSNKTKWLKDPRSINTVNFLGVSKR